MNETRLGYYFARKPNGRITTVSCWGDKVEKEEREDVEVLEQIPSSVIRHCSNGIKILNLDRIIRGSKCRQD